MARAPHRRSSDAIDDVLTFWFLKAGPEKWFGGDASFDRECAARLGAHYEAAVNGRLAAWAARPDGALALIILLDQLSRNLFRANPAAFKQDARAVALAGDAIARRFDQRVSADAQAFFYIPYMHAEDIALQEKCVALFKARLPGSINIPYAVEHRDIIVRFGRFPHRNQILNRESTPAETAYLDAGGFAG